MWTADGDPPAAVGGLGLVPLGKPCQQCLRGLLEREAPVIDHVAIARTRDAAGKPVEGGVFVGMQPYHFDNWNGDTNVKDEGSRNRWNPKPPRSDPNQKDGAGAAGPGERRKKKHKMKNPIEHRWPKRNGDHEG